MDFDNNDLKKIHDAITSINTSASNQPNANGSYHCIGGAQANGMNVATDIEAILNAQLQNGLIFVSQSTFFNATNGTYEYTLIFYKP